MFNVLQDFEWMRDRKGYRIVPFKSLSKRWRDLKAGDVDWIVPNGGKDDEIKYRPFASGGDIYAAFGSVKTPAELVRFINAHGPLTWGGRVIANNSMLPDFPAGEPVTLGLAEAEKFRELLRLRILENPRKLASHFQTKIAGFLGGGQVGQVEVLSDPERGIRLKISPPTLIGALWYQLALKLSEAALKMCPFCHTVFEVGRGTGRRTDAKFCCNEHKVEFFNRSRPRKAASGNR